MVVKYALHPGYVRSKNDNDEHFVSGTQLARLYGVKLGECIEYGGANRNGYTKVEDLIHLHPRRDGNYTLPEA